MGFYTEIVDIEAPDSASEGEEICVVVEIKSKATGELYQCIGAVGLADSTQFYFLPLYAYVAPQATASFSRAIIMPGSSIRVYVWPYIWTGEEWFVDGDPVYIDIALHVGAGWILLASTVITLEKSEAPAGWIQLAESTVVVEKSVVYNWVVLAERDVGLRVTPVPPPPPPEPPPPEEREIPWVPMALIGGGAALMIASAKPKKGKGLTKPLQLCY